MISPLTPDPHSSSRAATTTSFLPPDSLCGHRGGANAGLTREDSGDQTAEEEEGETSKTRQNHLKRESGKEPLSSQTLSIDVRSNKLESEGGNLNKSMHEREGRLREMVQSKRTGSHPSWARICLI